MSLSPEQERVSAELMQLIRAEIEAGRGWLSFERFMELALYAPGLGYYSAGSVKIGAGGDFVTAPEVSDLFSCCLAAQCREVLELAGGDILELGAGTGRMAATVLEALAEQGALPARYLILEVSADLTARQRERIAQLPAALASRVQWLTSLPEQPLSGVILANEVLDALPTNRIALIDGVPHERGVGLSHDGALVDCDVPLAGPLAAAWDEAVRGLPGELPPGYSTELCTRVTPWIASIAPLLARGALLLLDYGLPRAQLYHPQRVQGTLRCHFRQTAHDNPYIHIGMQDITAWVDFTRVAEAADSASLQVAGFTTQAAFLLACGIERFVMAAGDHAATHARLAGEARRLLLPGEMGESFKVMALTRALPRFLTGFTLQDLSASL
jgi:SAM-dependent MidA family methyltransferase